MKSKLLFVACLCAALAVSCSSKNEVKLTSNNPSAYITDSAKYEMIHSLKSIDGDRFYEMDYPFDYKLDELVESNVSSIEQLFAFMATNLLDVTPDLSKLSFPGAGCSAFATTEKTSGDFLMGRNYDFCHVENGKEVPITAIMINLHPKNGKKSINMVDSYWMGYPHGFYNDGKTDLSMLIGAPYSVLDGMNEDGFAMGILHLGGNPTEQADPEKKSLWGNVLIRYLLDKASNVDEAIELAKNFNINMKNPAKGNNHFFLADASGNYAILEYTYDDKEEVTETSVPNRMLVLKGEDYSYVTNFYVDPFLANNEEFGGLATKGKARYQILQGTLNLNAYKLTYEQARDLLKSVSQDTKPEENTSHTQWSALYNLTQKTMDISILQEFEKKYSFELK